MGAPISSRRRVSVSLLSFSMANCCLCVTVHAAVLPQGPDEGKWSAAPLETNLTGLSDQPWQLKLDRTPPALPPQRNHNGEGAADINLAGLPPADPDQREAAFAASSAAILPPATLADEITHRSPPTDLTLALAQPPTQTLNHDRTDSKPALAGVPIVAVDVAAAWELGPADRTLAAALSRWAATAGWQFVWELPTDYAVETRTTIHDTFDGAVRLVAESMGSAEIPMKAIFYAGNKVLRIVAKEGK